MRKVRTAIIGCGKVTDLHAAALKQTAESEFVAVYSRDREKAKKYGEKYGVQGFADIQEMIVSAKVEAVIICTPHPAHRDAAIAAAEAGAHVLVEKPLASSLQDCDAMLAAAKKANIKLGTVCQRRFYAPVQRVRRAIDEGKIGRPALGTVLMLGWRDRNYYESDPWRGQWQAEGGGVLVNQAPHQLDLLQWFMGPIAELFGVWSNFNHPYIEVEDTAVAIVRFQSGAVGNIVVSNSQKPGIYGKVHVHGQNGASVGVQTDGGAMFIAGMSSILEPPVNDIWTVPGEETLLEQWKQQDSELFNGLSNAMEHYHHLQISDFLQAIISDREPLVTGEEGRKTVEIFTAIYRSQKTNAPVKFPLKPEPSDLDYSTYASIPLK
ncbi:Gfo/Idh/MocA family protein [Propionivibrio limicola]|uniref:Gfo/Idh/MocA family protein n=1 Tax=Propionivibrio limicola TaxID=167645 RepID=UPI00248443D0|nr:Gfo/Idh/MocA family oxidoreductase [Propionivibrio limicola]